MPCGKNAEAAASPAATNLPGQLNHMLIFVHQIIPTAQLAYLHAVVLFYRHHLYVYMPFTVDAAICFWRVVFRRPAGPKQ